MRLKMMLHYHFFLSQLLSFMCVEFFFCIMHFCPCLIVPIVSKSDLNDKFYIEHWYGLQKSIVSCIWRVKWQWNESDSWIKNKMVSLLNKGIGNERHYINNTFTSNYSKCVMKKIDSTLMKRRKKSIVKYDRYPSSI